MQVVYGLAGVVTAVGDHPVAVFQALGPGNLGNDRENMGNHSAVFGADAVAVGNVCLGHHQNMGGSLGSDVPESQDGIVLVNLGRGDVPGDDLAE